MSLKAQQKTTPAMTNVTIDPCPNQSRNASILSSSYGSTGKELADYWDYATKHQINCNNRNDQHFNNSIYNDCEDYYDNDEGDDEFLDEAMLAVASAEEYAARIIKLQQACLTPLKEDLADWLNKILNSNQITVHNFMDKLDNGVIICKLAKIISSWCEEQLNQQNPELMKQLLKSAPSFDHQSNNSRSYKNNITPTNKLTSNYHFAALNADVSDKQQQFNDNKFVANLATPLRNPTSRLADPNNANATVNSNIISRNRSKSTSTNCLPASYAANRLMPSAATTRTKNAQSFQLNQFIENLIHMSQTKIWEDAKCRTFYARDNVCNFIKWSKQFGVNQSVLFESDDLVLHANPRQVVLCLLDVARIACVKHSFTEAPGLVKFEQEIDRELAALGESGTALVTDSEDYPAPARRKKPRPTEELATLYLRIKDAELNGRNSKTLPLNSENTQNTQAQQQSATSCVSSVADLTFGELSPPELDSSDGSRAAPCNREALQRSKIPRQQHQHQQTNVNSFASVCNTDDEENDEDDDDALDDSSTTTSSSLLTGANKTRRFESDLDGKVMRIAKSYYGMQANRGITRLSEGKYKIADRIVFVRLLKGQHVMVRIGGGWDTLQNFLFRHKSNPSQVIDVDHLLPVEAKMLLEKNGPQLQARQFTRSSQASNATTGSGGTNSLSSSNLAVHSLYGATSVAPSSGVGGRTQPQQDSDTSFLVINRAVSNIVQTPTSQQNINNCGRMRTAAFGSKAASMDANASLLFPATLVKSSSGGQSGIARLGGNCQLKPSNDLIKTAQDSPASQIKGGGGCDSSSSTSSTSGLTEHTTDSSGPASSGQHSSGAGGSKQFAPIASQKSSGYDGSGSEAPTSPSSTASELDAGFGFSQRTQQEEVAITTKITINGATNAAATPGAGAILLAQQPSKLPASPAASYLTPQLRTRLSSATGIRQPLSSLPPSKQKNQVGAGQQATRLPKQQSMSVCDRRPVGARRNRSASSTNVASAHLAPTTPRSAASRLQQQQQQTRMLRSSSIATHNSHKQFKSTLSLNAAPFSEAPPSSTSLLNNSASQRNVAGLFGSQLNIESQAGSSSKLSRYPNYLKSSQHITKRGSIVVGANATPSHIPTSTSRQTHV